MAFRLMAFHYPRPEHRTEMMERVARAAEVMAAAPGSIVATAKFPAKEACLEALASAAASVDIAYDDRELRPRDVYHLVEPG